MRTLLFSLCLGLAALARAGSFDVFASVDRDHLELGESLQLKLGVKVQGQLDFPPQLDQPQFNGFDAKGPSQSQNVMWVNGAVTIEEALTWELTAVKAGTLVLGPFRIRAKDAKHGEVVKESPAIRVIVTRPKHLNFPGAQPQPTLDTGSLAGQAGQDDQLRDIKPDRPFPWGWLAAGLLLVLGLLFGLLTWWRRRPAAPALPPVPRDPGQYALEQLEKARQAHGAGAEAAFVSAAAFLLRDYLRHRLLRGPDCTLSEGLRAARRVVPALEQQAELGPGLLRLVFGGVPVEPADADWAYAQVRAFIILAERDWPSLPPADAVPGPSPKRKSRSRGKHGD